MNSDVLIVDIGMGNIFSIQRAVERLGFTAATTSSAAEIGRARKLILPGVGHFGRAMEHLSQGGLADALQEAVQGKSIPVLGICLGMQLMTRGSDEGQVAGLGWFNARVERFRIQDTVRYKVPHTGWNTLIPRTDSAGLLTGIRTEDEFYFVHGHHVVDAAPEIIAAHTQYETSFVSVLQEKNRYAVQFHPEKSHEAGARIVHNFLTEVAC